MRDDQRTATTRGVRERMLDRGFGLVVDRRGRFVENEDRRVPIQRAGQRDALTLSARELRAALADRARIAFGQRDDEAMRLGRTRSGFDLCHVGRAVAIRDVVGDASVGEERLLRDIADHAAQCGGIERGDVLPVECDAARFWIDEAQQQFQQRALATAGSADQRDGRAGGHVETHAIHSDAAVVGMAYVLEPQRALRTRIQHVRAARRQFGIEQIHHPIHRSHRTLIQIGHVGQPRQRPEQALREIHQCRIAADAELALQGQPAAV